ncbi:MAG: hypothetical protein ACTHOD_09315 [Motilibacteraceae bacterium]
MSWWEWTVLWTVLVLGALAVLGWLGFRLVRAGLRLLETLGAAADTLTDVLDVADGLGETRYGTPSRR